MNEQKTLSIQETPNPKKGVSYLQAWSFIEKSHQLLSKSHAIGMTPEQAALAMLTGYELGLSFTGALRVLYIAQNGAITLKPKGALSLMRSSGLLEKFEYSGDDTQQTVTIKRKNQPERSMNLTIEQAKKAGWKSSAWISTPSNMLRWRLIGWLADLEFTDIILGMPIADDSWMDVEITVEGEVEELNPYKQEKEAIKQDLADAMYIETDPPARFTEMKKEMEDEIIEKTKSIPNYGYGDLETLLNNVSVHDIYKVNNKILPVTPEQINKVVHKLVQKRLIDHDFTNP